MLFTKVGRSVFVVCLVLALLAMGSGAQGQPPCTVTVQPGESIQKAIDQAAEGAVICLGVGQWQENLVITKSLTLQGIGKEPKEVRIVGAKERHPVIRIESEREIEVVIENLTAAEARELYCAVREPQWICPDGLQALGKAKVIIKDVQVSGSSWAVLRMWDSGAGLRVWDSATVNLIHSMVSNSGNGLEVWGSAQVSLSYSTVSNNGWVGLDVGGAATASVSYSTISKNGSSGLWMRGSAQVSLSHSTISNNQIGIVLMSSGQVSLSHSTVSKNGSGGLIAEVGSATVNLQNSTVSDNWGDGLVVGGLTTVKIKESEISSNARHGIFLKENAVAEIWGNRIINNGGYGVALYREGCVDYYDADYKFVGQVTGEGNTIPGKDEPDGNKKGDLCPPDYPWPPGFRK